MKAKKKTIYPIRIIETYETGVPKWLESAGLRFHWYSWIVCEVSLARNNVHHYSLFTDFMMMTDHKTFMANCWNPSYAPAYKCDILLKDLYYWKPVSIALLDSNLAIGDIVNKSK